MDFAALTTYLMPFLPYLIKAGDAFGKEAATKFGAGMWANVQAIWDRLADRIAGKPAAEEAVNDAATHPDDPRVQAALELQLEKLLEGDPELLEAINRLWTGASAGTTVMAQGNRSMAAGTIKDSTLITGDRNTVQR